MGRNKGDWNQYERKKLIQIKQKDLKAFRHKQWLKQGEKCAVCHVKIPFDKSVVDHKHKRKNDSAGVDGNGMIRGVLHKDINQLEGKITKIYRRYALWKVAPLSVILKGLSEYLENPPVNGLLHPSCIPKTKKKKLNATDIKRVKKYWKQMYPRRKFPKINWITKKNKKPIAYVTKSWAEYIRQSRKLAGLK